MSEAVMQLEPQEKSMDDLLAELTVVRTSIDEQNKTLKNLNGQKMAIEAKLKDAMREHGIQNMGNASCQVSVKEETYYRPNPEEWEDFLKWIYAEEHLHVLKRDFNNAAVRELVSHLSEEGSDVPHIIANTVEKLSYRKARN
jgi:hypothetical protein